MKFTYHLQPFFHIFLVRPNNGRTLFLYILLTLISGITAHAQTGKNFLRKSNTSNTVFIQFTSQKTLAKDPTKLFEENLHLSKHDAFLQTGLTKDIDGFAHTHYQQYHKGIKVEYGILKVHTRNALLQAVTGEQFEIPAIKTTPTFSEKAALEKAMDFIGAKVYMWQLPGEEKSFPSAELVICKVTKNAYTANEMALAYKFDIYAHDPISRDYIYVDAHTGRIVHTDAIIKHASGTASTRYSGTRNIDTEQTPAAHRLHDLTRGAGIETYNLKNSTTYTAAVDFTDDDNNWTTAEYRNMQKDDAALDAHWGAAMTYDYFKNVHGRNSFDGKGAAVKNYVHYGVNYFNAFWDGKIMTYGDGGAAGNNTIQPFTSLDIVAHEIGHAVCQHSANLVYSFESGALNEGFSDIWAATIENHTEPEKNMWVIGEDISFTIRSMSNPKAFDQPDTYLGTFWYSGTGDNGGVHTNSGVLNYWYYLLATGKSGVNDNGDAYSIAGIGVSKAAKIAYRTETVYLTPNATYTDARTFSIQAAIDLYGENAPEVVQTIKAWNAVGVYETPAAPGNLAATTLSPTQIRLNWTDLSNNETGFQIERSLSPGSGFVKIATVAAGTTSYINLDLLSNFTYYYRVQATNKTIGSGYSNEASATVGNAPIVMSNATVTTCDASFLDPGGIGNYFEDQTYVMTFQPTSAGRKIKVSFMSFNTEEGFDYLTVYDGMDINAPVLGRYTGKKLPATLTATNSSGALTFKFYSDGNVVASGWQAVITCTGTQPGKLKPVITLNNLQQTYDGGTKTAIAVTEPAGLPVMLTYNGTADAPVNAGMYTVTATVNTDTYQATVEEKLVVVKAAQTIHFQSIPDSILAGQSLYLQATATSGLPVSFAIKSGMASINGTSVSFNETGHVTIDAIQTGNENYLAASPVRKSVYVKQYIVQKLQQAITFQPVISQPLEAQSLELVANASSHLPVRFRVISGPVIIAGNVLAFTGAGPVVIQAIQEGNELYTAATPVDISFCILPSKPVISVSGNSLFPDASLLLTSSSDSGNQWLLNGTAIEGATGKTYAVTQPGNYAVQVSAGTCESISDFFVLTSVAPLAVTLDIQVYPNPTANQVTVVYTAGEASKQVKALVYNSLGLKVDEKNLSQISGKWQEVFQLLHLPAGNYILTIQDGNKLYHRKIIKN